MEDKDAAPPSLYDYAMNVGGVREVTKLVPTLSLPLYERKYGDLCDFGDATRVLKDVVSCSLFSPDAFWDHMRAKNQENYMYITNISQMHRWTAAVWCVLLFLLKYCLAVC